MGGVIMIAMGHENYLKMAVNLAASIKANDTCLIHLIHDGGYSLLGAQEASLFDSHAEYIHQEKMDFIKPKTELYELSPFDKTLYLDVDMVFLVNKKVGDLLSGLSGTDFAIMNQGREEKCLWADPAEVRKVTGDTHPMHVFYSECLYFEKNPKTKDFFKKVKAAYNKPKVKTMTFAGSHMPDELAFIIASLQTGLLPHQENWLPVYWYLRDKKYRHMQPYELPFYAYSIGGNVVPEYGKAHYNNLVSYYSKIMGISDPYKVRDKRSYLPERVKY